MTVHQFDRQKALAGLTIIVETLDPVTTPTYEHLGFSSNQASQLRLTVTRSDGARNRIQPIEVPVNTAGRFDLQRLIQETKLRVAGPTNRDYIGVEAIAAIRRLPLDPVNQLTLRKTIADPDGQTVGTVELTTAVGDHVHDKYTVRISDAHGHAFNAITHDAERDAIDAISVENLLANAGALILAMPYNYFGKPIGTFIRQNTNALHAAFSSEFETTPAALLAAEQTRPTPTFELNTGLVGMEVDIDVQDFAANGESVSVGTIRATHLGYDPTRRGDRFRIQAFPADGDVPKLGFVDVERMAGQPLSTRQLCFEIEELAKTSALFPPSMLPAMATLQRDHLDHTSFTRPFYKRLDKEVGSVRMERVDPVELGGIPGDVWVFSYTDDHNELLSEYETQFGRTADGGFNLEAMLSEVQDCLEGAIQGERDHRTTPELVAFAERREEVIQRNLQPEMADIVFDLPARF